MYMGFEDETRPGGYAWEKGFEKSWEMVEEDEEGRIKMMEDKDSELLKRRRMANTIPASVKRSIIRYLYLAVDLSEAMAQTDLRPNRMAAALALVEDFVKEYFDQNPLSQLGLLITREGVAQRVSPLSGAPRAHLAALRKVASCRGLASLQNTIEMATTSLKAVPEYGSRELIIIYGSLSTCDPGDIHDTIEQAKKARVRISIIGLSAEVYICRRAAEATGGTYAVATGPPALRQGLMAAVAPPAERAGAGRGPAFADLVAMGFPRRVFSDKPAMGYSGAAHAALGAAAHACPRCRTRVADLPAACPVCALPLVSSPHIARSYHHLFPVPPFQPVPTKSQEVVINSVNDIDTSLSDGGVPISGATTKDKEEPTSCAACLVCISLEHREESSVPQLWKCPKCSNVFCQECDIYIHNTLHNCPCCC